MYSTHSANAMDRAVDRLPLTKVDAAMKRRQEAKDRAERIPAIAASIDWDEIRREEGYGRGRPSTGGPKKNRVRPMEKRAALLKRWREIWAFLGTRHAELDCETAATLFSTYSQLREHGVRIDPDLMTLLGVLFRQVKDTLDAFHEDSFDVADFEGDYSDYEPAATSTVTAMSNIFASVEPVKVKAPLIVQCGTADANTGRIHFNGKGAPKGNRNAATQAA